MPLNLVETDLNLTRLTSSVGNRPACSSWHTRHIILAEAGLSPTGYKRFIGHIILAEAGLSPTSKQDSQALTLRAFLTQICKALRVGVDVEARAPGIADEGYAHFLCQLDRGGVGGGKRDHNRHAHASRFLQHF